MEPHMAVSAMPATSLAIPLTAIREQDDFNPRTDIDPAALKQLANSIEIHGVLQPVLIAQDGDDEYRLIAGHRRVAAARHLGLAEIPAILTTGDADRDIDIAIIVNLQREDLSSI